MLHIKFLFHTHVNLARMFSGHGGFSVWFDMLLCNILYRSVVGTIA